MSSAVCRPLLGRFFQSAPWVMLPVLLVAGNSRATPRALAPAAASQPAFPSALRAAYIASVQTDAAPSPAYRIDPASHRAQNPRQKLTGELSAAGLRLAGTSGGETFHAALALQSYGCAAHPVAAQNTAPKVTQNRVEYVRRGITEWYVNGPLGVEQGFTLATAPRCGTSHQLVVNLAWDTALVPTLVQAADTAGARLELRDGAGNVQLTYSDLYAYDAAGRKLPAQLALVGHKLALHVDDQGAQYPVTIDPLIWSQQTKLLSSDGTSGDTFGSSVALSGDIAVIGDPFHDYNTTNQGAAYVFVRSGTQWTQQQRLLATADYGANDNYGTAVAIAGDTIVIGAPSHFGTAASSGQVYVYLRTGTLWSEQARLTVADGASGDLLGRSVAIDGDTLVAGAPFADLTGQVDAGAAYVFVRSGGVWTQQQKLQALDAMTTDAFGSAVAVSGNTAVIGAPKDDTTAGGTDVGSAYVFVRSGTTWTQQQQLVALDGVTNDQFGSAIALSIDTAVIGSPLADPMGALNAGAAYAFFRSGTTWSQQQKFTAVDGKSGDGLGAAVAVLGDTAVLGAGLADSIGTDAGAAYVWTRSGTTWSQQSKLTASDGIGSDQFGGGVAVATDYLIVGTPQRYESFTRRGAVYVFFHGQTTGDTCTTASQCVSNICINNTCRSGKLQGVTCSVDSECATGFCADGLCCDTACGGSVPDCQTCSGGGAANGTCTVQSSAIRCRAKANECDVVEYCDGKTGQCPADVGIGDGMPCAFGTCHAALCIGDAPLAYVPAAENTGCTLVTTHRSSQATAGVLALLVLVLLRRSRRRVA